MDFEIPEELKMVQNSVRQFVKDELMDLEREILGREGDPTTGRVALPPDEERKLFEMVDDMGLWGISVPEELGGPGLPLLGLCLVEEELAKTIVPFSFGDVSPILFDASEEQRQRYLQPLITNEKRSCVALLEGASDDPISMATTAARENGDYVLNGRKLCMAHVTDPGDFTIVFAVTDKEKGVRGGVTCFLVDRDTPGYTVTGTGERAGRFAQVIEPIVLTFDNCRVPAANVLGEDGKAFHLGAKWLPQRRIAKGARCVGAADRLLEICKEYTQNWAAFGHLIQERPSVHRDLADIAIGVHAARLMVYHAAFKADLEEDIHKETAMVKVFATEMVERASDRATQLHGGPMYTRNLPMSRLCRNAVAASASDQALELQRTIIAKDILRY
ncbi:MAG: acyl-CoA dehydrogenase family protein [Chloroflexota bacterium]|nr:acyl-CoA dehydrogenase family protein [Chloroflexota bacterium]